MNTRVRAWMVLIGLLCMVAAPVLAVLDYNLWGGDQFRHATGDTPMPVHVWVLFFGGVALVVAAIIATALAKPKAR